MKRKQKIYLPFKRFTDIIGSIIGILICSITLWWWIILINLFFTKGHPFFTQKRYGKDKKIFDMHKFRSMRIDVDSNIAPSEMTQEEQDKMVTSFGRFLRISSLDESLQLIDVLIGKMSFIGPRPGSAHNEEFLVQCREGYVPSAFDVKPGISGYSQIKMKREHDPEFKAFWDHQYVLRMSFLFDVGIFFYTIFKILGVVKGR